MTFPVTTPGRDSPLSPNMDVSLRYCARRFSFHRHGRYEVNGLNFVEVKKTGTRLAAFFSKPAGAPDHQPFHEPNQKV